MREVRQLARRSRAVQCSLTLGIGLMSVELLLWLLVRNHERDFPIVAGFIDPAMLWLLPATHALLCMLVAAYGGFRIFLTEHYRATLENLLLIPEPPLRWLLLKLSFPVAAALLVWLAGLPLYMMAVLTDLIPIGDLPYVMHRPLLGACGIIIGMLIATPRYVERMQKAQANRLAGIRTIDKELPVWSMLTFGYAYALGVGLVAGKGLCAEPCPFYTVTIPEYLYWVGVAGVFIPTAFLTALTVLLPGERWVARATLAQRSAALVCYYLLMGVVYPLLPVWGLWILLLVPLCFAIALHLAVRSPREDARAEAEIAWIAARCDNPLTIKDLRVYSRYCSIRRSVIWTLAICLLGVASLPLLILYWGPAGLIAAAGSAGGGLVEACIMIQVGIWTRARLFWYKEWASQTLLLLLLTPLTSDEILLGRLLAVPLYYGLSMLPPALLCVAALLWLSSLGYWIALPAALVLSPLNLTCGIVMACSVRRTNPLTLFAWFGDIRLIGLLLLQLLSLVIDGAFIFAGLTIPRATQAVLTPWMAWPLSLLLFAANAGLAWAWFRFSVRQLERLRRGDMQLPDSKVMERQLLSRYQTASTG
jgi:hypothetical protein